MDGGKMGQRIREKRKERGLSLKSLAKAIGKTPSFLSQVERDLAEPSITSLRDIAGPGSANFLLYAGLPGP